MKKAIFPTLAFTLVSIFAWLLISHITVEYVEPSAPSKPLGVPTEAIWVGGAAGGYFFVLESFAGDINILRASIYHDHSGEVEFSGVLRVSESKKVAITVEDIYGWDGAEIHLTDGRTLIPLEP
ncbi:hypothetical protein [Vibrio sp. SCSIO 43136]|uniref:hypothetical protein n=1 Tax=Vibrio sp. SCSIO 43136 TaxID=2819101 RepID=UPI00207584E4|nr:hypothetical protein [Vibrio sp. SCSIO 43136]USD66044.1 hypothetical protein J4N39_04260 [Vibrio sp. SCSIO 43136]